ncbi:MAG: hypothetical protein HFI31_12610 [Lachnospiraceae bacterium]|nr:hypothetical protein [Lachnospiraceae bacterium]
MGRLYVEIGNQLKKYKFFRLAKKILRNMTPKRIRFQYNLVKVYIFDKLHGTNFGGRLYQEKLGISKERANDYSPSPVDLVKALEKLKISTEDAIVDMGSGKGYAMYKMAKYPFALIGGVELSKDLCTIAKKNLEIVMPKKKKWQIYNCDAGTWPGYDNYNIFYIYNSFPLQVMREVNENICESIRRKPRKVTLLYLFPEFPETFMSDKRWKLIERGTTLQLRNGMHIFQNVFL